MIFSNSKIYDVLKWAVLAALPAISWFLITVLPLYGVGESAIHTICGTLDALTTLIGVLVGVSSIKYHNSVEGKHLKND